MSKLKALFLNFSWSSLKEQQYLLSEIKTGFCRPYKRKLNKVGISRPPIMNKTNTTQNTEVYYFSQAIYDYMKRCMDGDVFIYEFTCI